MRVLHLVKTSEGALWAAFQAAELSALGVEVHVALPTDSGRAIPYWLASGARLHFRQMDFPLGKPWRLPAVLRSTRELVAQVSPDLIHSHFVGTTLVMRLALGPRHPIPRVFQIPGPLHMEHALYRNAEIFTAGPRDFRIPSSRYTYALYRAHGIPSERLALSYYGTKLPDAAPIRTGNLRKQLGISDDELVVGNINHIYPPKFHVGHRVGLKGHEDIIEALSLLVRCNPSVRGVLLGSQFPSGTWYIDRLRRRAEARGGGKITMPGHVESGRVPAAWADFDCAVHAPLSENCGGVVEPLLAGIPTVAGHVGGLPELVIDGVTGRTVHDRSPCELARTITEVLSDLPKYRKLAERGQRLAFTMFDVRRTAAEVKALYEHLLVPGAEKPPPFDSREFVAEWGPEFP